MLKVEANLDTKAITLANSRTGDVFVQAFRAMIVKETLDFDDEEHFRFMDKQSRNTGCGCWLCKLRYEYTWRKKERHRIMKRITNDEFIYMTGSCTNVRDFTNFQEDELYNDKKEVIKLEEELSEILYAKKVIKAMIGYDKHKKLTRVLEKIPLREWGIQNLRTDLFL